MHVWQEEWNEFNQRAAERAHDPVLATGRGHVAPAVIAVGGVVGERAVLEGHPTQVSWVIEQAKIDSVTIGSSSGGDFHLNGHCDNFPSDIRFTKNNGFSLLDYWIEDPSQDPITVWVKIEDNLDHDVDIYCYLGVLLPILRVTEKKFLFSLKTLKMGM